MLEFKEYLKIKEFNVEMTLAEWMGKNLLLEAILEEAVTATRYSVEVNFRSKVQEVAEAFAKICLGYVSAALKQNGFHVKHVYDERPIRVLISSRNWDDGEWVCVVTFNSEEKGGCFVVSKGFYNKERRTVAVQSTSACEGTSAADITKQVRNIMHGLKDQPDRHREKLKGVPMKRGPKR